jgi:hypothetical protein
MPSTIPATAKVKARTEQRLPHSGNVPGPQANTQFIASTK